MASIITATTTNGLVSSADNSGVLQLASGTGNLVTVPSVTGTMLTTGSVVAQANGGTGTTTGYYGFKNRIINGAMTIDQRNAGASITPLTSGTWYAADRFNINVTQSSKFTSQQSSTAPTGFGNSVVITSSSAYSVVSGDAFTLRQIIEGYNFADCAWGTASAATVTLSFWVRSSLTGTFGGSFTNSDASRSNPFSYTINAANTWEQKTITVAGDTTGTWVGATNGRGVVVYFGLGVGSTYSGTAGSWSSNNYQSATGATSVVGTNGATFYITGVQLEVGSTATSFDYRPYGTEFMLCQRYYQQTGGNGAPFGNSSAYSSTFAIGNIFFPVTMRTKPTGISTTGSFAMFTNGSSYAVTLTYDDASTSGVRLVLNGTSLPSTGSFDFRASGTATIGFTGAEL